MKRRTAIIFYTGAIIAPTVGLASLVALVAGDGEMAARLAIGAGLAFVVWLVALAWFGDPSTLTPTSVDFKRFGETFRWW